jgi:ketosteroid isomerase-like protein
MRSIVIALAFAVFAAGQTAAFAQAPAAARADVLAAVHQFVDGFNKGDTKAAVAACAEQTSIIDEFPPHEWHGAGACEKWLSDFDAYGKKNGITDGIVTLGTPSHVDIAADRAYVVIPSNYAFKNRGKAEQEKGAMFTFALRKNPAGWRITGWAWAKP